MNKALVSIGGANRETVKEVRAAINDILNAAHADSAVKQEALRTLVALARSGENTSLMNCSFQGPV